MGPATRRPHGVAGRSRPVLTETGRLERETRGPLSGFPHEVTRAPLGPCPSDSPLERHWSGLG